MWDGRATIFYLFFRRNYFLEVQRDLRLAMCRARRHAILKWADPTVYNDTIHNVNATPRKIGVGVTGEERERRLIKEMNGNDFYLMKFVDKS